MQFNGRELNPASSCTYDPENLPCECNQLQSDSKFIFSSNRNLFWLFISAVLLLYLGIGFKLYSLRRETWMKARSPKLVLLGVVFLAGDTIGNGFIFYGD